MKKIFALLLALTMVIPSFADEEWEKLSPGNAKIGNSISANYDYKKMRVPSGMSGRSVDDKKISVKLDVNNNVRFQHDKGDLTLKGRSTRMNMDYTRDILDVSIFKSNQTQSGTSSCMDCHKRSMPRTIITIGAEYIKGEADPYKMNTVIVHLNDAKSTAFRSEIDHWMNANLMLKGSIKFGKIEQSGIKLDASAFTIGIGGYLSSKLTWSADLNISKVEGYNQRKTLIGKLQYKLGGGLKAVAEGGAFLDGYTQFGTEFAEIGMLVNDVVSDETLLPSMFQKMKNDSFGYWSAGLEYEYHF